MNQQVLYLELLMEMISIPATSRNEKVRSDFLEKYLKGIGFEVIRIHNNLLVGDVNAHDSRPKILLNSHLDTVSPVEGWQTDPFLPINDGEKIIGLGSNDAGASVVTMIASYQSVYAEVLKHINLMLLISAEEEVSGSYGITSVLEILGALDGVIVGEPTGMKPAVAERGLMVLDGEIKGKAGHAARNEGQNAIYLAMKDVDSIGKMEFPKPSKWLPQPGAQVTMISAGTNHNVVPDVCRFVVDVRSNDIYGNEAMLESMQSICGATLIPRSTRLKPSSLEEGNLLMETVRKCGYKPFGSSTLSDMALIPFPTLKMGPGDSTRSHTAGEFILTKELDEGVAIYCRFLTTMKEMINN